MGSSAGHGIPTLRTSKQALSAPTEDAHFLRLRWEELINRSHPSLKKPAAAGRLAKSPGVGPGLWGGPFLQPPYVLINLFTYMDRNVYRKLEQSGEDRSLYTHSGGQTGKHTKGPQMASEVRGIAQGVMVLWRWEWERAEGRVLQREGTACAKAQRWGGWYGWNHD